MKPALLVVLVASVAAALTAGRGDTLENPFATHALASPFETSGVVVERVPAGGYLYLKLRDVAGAESWVVTLARTAPAPASADVRVTVFARADTFSSKRLGRTFEPLLFGAVRAASTPTPPESP
ncbi:MAG: hypothetical protein Q8S33_08600 [Myxococcales bacterium]|nr:hypothetical protein [Myxococcales bacterium]